MSDTNVVLLGVGAIGRELLRQLATNHRTSTRRSAFAGWWTDPGMSSIPADSRGDASWSFAPRKDAGTSLAQTEGGTPASPETSVATLTTRLPRRSILVDATAAETRPMLEAALQRASTWCWRTRFRSPGRSPQSIGSTRSPTRAGGASCTRRRSARACR